MGDPLIRIDLNLLNSKGYDTTTPIVFLSGQKVHKICDSQCVVLQRDVITII